jgi:hypothetical protein
MLMLRVREGAYIPALIVPVTTPVAVGPEVDARVAEMLGPAARPVKEKVLVQEAPAMVMLPVTGNRPSELAAAWMRLAVPVAVDGVPDAALMVPV